MGVKSFEDKRFLCYSYGSNVMLSGFLGFIGNKVAVIG